jgi:hypothetical protein
MDCGGHIKRCMIRDAVYVSRWELCTGVRGKNKFGWGCNAAACEMEIREIPMS